MVDHTEVMLWVYIYIHLSVSLSLIVYQLTRDVNVSGSWLISALV